MDYFRAGSRVTSLKMTEKNEKKKRDEFTIKIGPLLKKILEQQKENIVKAGFGCLKPSEYDAGEIIAKKIMQRGGIKPCEKNVL